MLRHGLWNVLVSDGSPEEGSEEDTAKSSRGYESALPTVVGTVRQNKSRVCGHGVSFWVGNSEKRRYNEARVI